MNKSVKIGIGSVVGAGLGSATGKLASSAINRALLKRISDLDDQLDNMLSKRQLEMKSKLEKRSRDLDLISKSHPDYFEVEVQVKRLTKDLLGTLRPDQLKVYNTIALTTSNYLEKTKTLSIVFGLIGGFAGGIIVSQLN